MVVCRGPIYNRDLINDETEEKRVFTRIPHLDSRPQEKDHLETGRSVLWEIKTYRKYRF